MNNGRDVVFTNCSFTGEVEVTTSVEVELPTRFYYDGLVGKPYNDTTSNKLYINGVDVTDLKPVAPEPKTLEVDHVECYGDWFMKVFLKYDGFTFEDINRSTIVVTMSNNSAPSTGEQVGYAGNFFIRIDANERGDENKATGTSFTALVAFELNDGTPCSVEFKVHNGAVVDEFPTPEPEQPETPVELPTKPEGALYLVLGGNWNPHGDGFLVFGWTNAGLTNDIIAEYKVTAIINGVESAFTFDRTDGAVHAFFRNTDLGTGIGGASYILVVEFTTTDGTVYFAAVNVVNGNRA